VGCCVSITFALQRELEVLLQQTEANSSKQLNKTMNFLKN
jgi:hypothetical protein